MFLGDPHGDKRWLDNRFMIAAQQGCEAIFALGDLGYGFPLEQDNEKPLLHHLNKWANKYNVDFYFVDGNHDNHPQIWADGSEHGPFLQLEERVFFIPRGSVFDYAGVSFLGLGGAYSIDKDQRIAYEKATGLQTWWPTELITDAQVEAAINNAAEADIDVMLTHDAPWHVFRAIKRPELEMRINYKHDVQSRMQQRKVYEVAKQVHPKILLHGHWHHRYEHVLDFYGENPPVTVIGLGMNTHPSKDIDDATLVWKLPDDINVTIST